MFEKLTLILYTSWIKVKRIFRKKTITNNLLIIKIDAIGDFILFRNFLYEIADSEKYKGCKITLIGNIIWKDLAFEIDNGIIHEFIPLDKNDLNKNLLTLIKWIDKKNYKTLINFHYSRNIITEFISFVVSAENKIAMKGNTSVLNSYLLFFFNKMYRFTVYIPSALNTEFAFNKYFTENLVNAEIHLSSPHIHLDMDKCEPIIPHAKYIIIAPGAGVINRQSSILTYVKISEFLLKKKYIICFIGSASDSIIINDIISQITPEYINSIINLSGKIPLNLLPYVISRSLFVVCNDSSIYHFSVALNKYTLCIAGGGHFKRFVNYVNRGNVKICYKSMPCFNCDWKCIFKFDTSNPYPCISDIDLNTITENIISLEKQWLNDVNNFMV